MRPWNGLLYSLTGVITHINPTEWAFTNPILFYEQRQHLKFDNSKSSISTHEV